MEIPLEDIEPNPWNPRTSFEDMAMQDLIDSIKRFGVLQAICVRPHPKKKGKYEIVYGQRRWIASKKLNFRTIPVKEPIKAISDKEAVDIMGDENIKRQAYSPVELAKYLDTRRKILGESESALANRFGVDKSHISDIIQLERLPDEIKPRVSWGIATFAKDTAERGVGLKPTPITFSHARELLRVPKRESQIQLANKIEREGLTVVQTKREVEGILGAKTRPAREVDTGIIWTCPICKKEYHLLHISPANSHRLEEVPK